VVRAQPVGGHRAAIVGPAVAPSAQRLPLVLYAHGGGFVFGDLDSHDRVCRRLALMANAAVLSVGYRRAPEHPAPAAVDDLFSVARWAAAAPDELGPVLPTPTLAGDSAGGTIAVLAAARLATVSTPLSAVLLICPNADLTPSQAQRERQRQRLGSAGARPALVRAAMGTRSQPRDVGPV
jgi:acetyl esterase